MALIALLGFKSGELVGFRSGDYKLISSLISSLMNSQAKKKSGVSKNPVPVPVSSGGGRNLTGDREPGVKCKNGTAAATATVPALLIVINVPGSRDWLIIAFQQLIDPLFRSPGLQSSSCPRTDLW